ncbi:MAG: hypothetical protein K0S65_5534 [Labilithrix sp.]|nr:hypothetical protein [Labilithrix sp.]
MIGSTAWRGRPRRVGHEAPGGLRGRLIGGVAVEGGRIAGASQSSGLGRHPQALEEGARARPLDDGFDDRSRPWHAEHLENIHVERPLQEQRPSHARGTSRRGDRRGDATSGGRSGCWGRARPPPPVARESSLPEDARRSHRVAPDVAPTSRSLTMARLLAPKVVLGRELDGAAFADRGHLALCGGRLPRNVGSLVRRALVHGSALHRDRRTRLDRRGSCGFVRALFERRAREMTMTPEPPDGTTVHGLDDVHTRLAPIHLTSRPLAASGAIRKREAGFGGQGQRPAASGQMGPTPGSALCSNA